MSSSALAHCDAVIETFIRRGQRPSIQIALRTARVRKTLDRLAYASLVLDICIAVITVLTFFDIGNPEPLLVPINYLLTIVVVLSVIMFAVLILLRSEERQATRTMEESRPPS